MMIFLNFDITNNVYNMSAQMTKIMVMKNAFQSG